MLWRYLVGGTDDISKECWHYEEEAPMNLFVWTSSSFSNASHICRCLMRKVTLRVKCLFFLSFARLIKVDKIDQAGHKVERSESDWWLKFYIIQTNARTGFHDSSLSRVTSVLAHEFFCCFDLKHLFSFFFYSLTIWSLFSSRQDQRLGRKYLQVPLMVISSMCWLGITTQNTMIGVIYGNGTNGWLEQHKVNPTRYKAAHITSVGVEI